MKPMEQTQACKQMLHVLQLVLSNIFGVRAASGLKYDAEHGVIAWDDYELMQTDNGKWTLSVYKCYPVTYWDPPDHDLVDIGTGSANEVLRLLIKTETDNIINDVFMAESEKEMSHYEMS